VSAGGVVSVKRTGYTVQVDTPARRYLFADRMTSAACFAAASKLKADVRRYAGTFDADTGEVVDIGVERASASAPRYYRVPVDTVLPSEAVCIDIRAAYPTTLRLLGLVTEEAYRAAMNLPKPDRLKCVGMLAATQYVQTFEDGRLVLTERKDSDTRAAFFRTCEHVGEVMERAAQASGAAFLFFWVDGIFVRPEAAGAVSDVLTSEGYEITSEPVSGIRRSPSGRYVFYTKGGKRTYLCVPQRHTFDGTELLKALADAPDI
jgi:hypothetical protein